MRLGVGTSPSKSRTARATGLWNASAVIIEHTFISFGDFEELLDPSTDDYTAVVSSDVKRIYFQSEPVEDYMRAELNEHTRRIGGTTPRCKALPM